jgi:hypothetical protein
MLTDSTVVVVCWVVRPSPPSRVATQAAISLSGTIIVLIREASRTWSWRRCGMDPPLASCSITSLTSRKSRQSNWSKMLFLSVSLSLLSQHRYYTIFSIATYIIIHNMYHIIIYSVITWQLQLPFSQYCLKYHKCCLVVHMRITRCPFRAILSHHSYACDIHVIYTDIYVHMSTTVVVHHIFPSHAPAICIVLCVYGEMHGCVHVCIHLAYTGQVLGHTC